MFLPKNEKVFDMNHEEKVFDILVESSISSFKEQRADKLR